VAAVEDIVLEDATSAVVPTAAASATTIVMTTQSHQSKPGRPNERRPSTRVRVGEVKILKLQCLSCMD
jgi:hypothetical protein